MFSLTTNVSTVTGGSDVMATITLNQPSASDNTFQLFSDIAGISFGTPTVTVQAGLIVATVSLRAPAVARDQTVTLAAVQLLTSPPVTSPPVGFAAAQTTQITVLRPRLVSFTLTPPSFVGGLASTGVVMLTGPLPQSGMALSFASDNPGVATVPAGPVTVPAGATSFTVAINSTLVPTATQVAVIAVLKLTATNTVELLAGTMTVQPTMPKGSLSKETKDKDGKDIKDKDKDAKDGKEHPKEGKENNKDGKDIKDKEGKEGKEMKDGKDQKEKEKEGKEPKDKNEGKEGKDKNEAKEHQKEGIDVKLPHETERRTFGDSGPPILVAGENDPSVWFRVLALRLDEVERRLAGARAFIGPKERPEVGRKAIDQADGDGRPS